MMTDVYKVDCSALPDTTRVVGFRGTEGISRLYVFDLYLMIPDAEVELGDIIGAKTSLTMDREDGRPPFVFHGIFAEVALLDDAGGRALIHGVLVPQLWQLGLSRHSRLFTDQSIPEILKSVLEEGGLTSDEYTLNLSQTYRPQEHVCQYQESDLDFISRWMEREGIYYYFEHRGDRERLIITDDKSSHEALVSEPIRFYSLSGPDVTAKESLNTFVCRHRSLPGRVRVKDYDYNKPTLDVSGMARVSRTGMGEVHLHGARVFTPEEGKRLARLRSEELLTREVVFQGTGTAPYLRAGYQLELQDHPRGAFDARYLVTELEHQGKQAASTAELDRLTGLDGDDVYRVHVTAIPEKVQFRPDQRTPWPRIHGFENGVVDGPADSEYAQIDDHGRYAVRFMFDESDLKDGKASTWVRMLQPHGGGVEGWHFPLRKGTEVLLTFLGGDPDRPVIAGVVPNAHTPSPVTRANHTTNVIQTGGRNRLELEDEIGAQRITMTTPYANTMLRMGAPNEDHELIVRTDSSALLDTGRRWDVRVGGILSEIVGGDVHETYNGFKSEKVLNDQVVETYKGHSTTVHTKRWQEYAQQEKLVKGLFKETIGIHKVTITGGGRKENITGGLEQTVSGGPGALQTVNGDKVTNVTGNWLQTIHGTVNQTVLGPVNHIKTDVHTLVTIGATSDTFIGVKNSNAIGGQLNVTVGQLINLKASGELSISVGASVAVDTVLKQTFTPKSIKVTDVKMGTTASVVLDSCPVMITSVGTWIIS